MGGGSRAERSAAASLVGERVGQRLEPACVLVSSVNSLPRVDREYPETVGQVCKSTTVTNSDEISQIEATEVLTAAFWPV